MTGLLALKLFLTPLFIGAVTLAGRRWGPGVSGLLVGLPLTSGPASLILALQYGPDFAARAAIGNLAGQASGCVFCLAYSLAAQRQGWPASSIVAAIAFALTTLLWNSASLSLLPTLTILSIVIIVAARIMPRSAAVTTTLTSPNWDLPARMITATTFVVLLTSFADTLGPQLSGLLSPFPLFANVLAAFTHHQQGGAAAGKFLRGVVLGSWAFAGFFIVVTGLLRDLGIGWTYALAVLAAVGVNGLFLLGERR